ncbi:GntR family transcriptional regulator [Halobacillus andaensis]|uniref:GntR family transcriptional regulator n=1 Tax=Halobacillus andaensis TaxID=1176239 RepID=A0A917EUW5_HALAA|nr:UTRA domain-containing protein [Halobacillus andaensis]MBP2004910.1 GntR family trehalose operon transcriptional repressor [Halobacillus andaensis]GGF17948.1 GntR family transcriptional regulator [Halobacillus andaensis]
MPRTKFMDIYEDLKDKIERHVFEYQQLIPSENMLVKEYNCSRNTVRRAIAELVSKGYLQTKHGKGVRVIYQEFKQNEYMFGETETFKQFAQRNDKQHRTEVVLFEEVIADEQIQEITSMPIGTTLYHLQRVRYLDGTPVIMDHNYFRADVVKGLTVEIAEDSIYEYLERELNHRVVTAKRQMIVEKTTPLDEKYLNLDGYNCVVVVTSYIYNENGVMFERTQSRHTPGNFVFFDQTQQR